MYLINRFGHYFPESQFNKRLVSMSEKMPKQRPQIYKPNEAQLALWRDTGALLVLWVRRRFSSFLAKANKKAGKTAVKKRNKKGTRPEMKAVWVDEMVDSPCDLCQKYMCFCGGKTHG